MRKKKKSCYSIMIVFIILVTILNVGCTKKNNTNLKTTEPPPEKLDRLIQGEVAAYIYYDVNLSDFLSSYTEYGLTLEYSGQEINKFVFSFNYHLINGNDLVEILFNDPRLFNNVRPYLLPGWIYGELIVGFDQSMNDVDIEKIILSYSQWGLKEMSAIKSINYYRFSFDPKLVNEFEIRHMIRNEKAVSWVDFNGPNRQWVSGTLLVYLCDNDFKSFLDTYSDLDLMVNEIFDELKLVSIKFDHNLIDEFYLLDMFLKDPKVEFARFNYIREYTGG